VDSIDYRTAALGTLRFGPPAHFIVVPGLELNDVTGTKQSLPRRTVIAIASGGGRAWWNGWGPSLGAVEPRRWPIRSEVVERVPGAALALDFDAGAGHLAADASDNRSHAAFGGLWAADLGEPGWVPGVSGAALRFDGEHHFLEVADAPNLDLQGSMTVEAWIRRANADEKATVLCKGLPGGRNYQVRVTPGGGLQFLWETHDGGKNHGAEARNAIQDTLWHHLACVYDRIGRESRIYVDGKLQGAAPDSGTATVNDLPLYIGVRQGEKSPKEWFAGSIDQVRLTADCRYGAEFTPASRFEASGPAGVFLDWTPAQAPGAETLEFDVFRAVAGSAPVQLNASPLHDPYFFDGSPPAGQLRYSVRCRGSGWPSPEPLELNWPPAPTPHIVTR
jgi:hypothetical protein